MKSFGGEKSNHNHDIFYLLTLKKKRIEQIPFLWCDFTLKLLLSDPSFCQPRAVECWPLVGLSPAAVGQSAVSPSVWQVVRASRLAVHRGAADEADGLVRESQADQQRAGPARTRENLALLPLQNPERTRSK